MIFDNQQLMKISLAYRAASEQIDEPAAWTWGAMSEVFRVPSFWLLSAIHRVIASVNFTGEATGIICRLQE
jgi:hypothetical protein